MHAYTCTHMHVCMHAHTHTQHTTHTQMCNVQSFISSQNLTVMPGLPGRIRTLCQSDEDTDPVSFPDLAILLWWWQHLLWSQCHYYQYKCHNHHSLPHQNSKLTKIITLVESKSHFHSSRSILFAELVSDVWLFVWSQRYVCTHSLLCKGHCLYSLFSCTSDSVHL